jgi:hypothetical protein
LSDIFDNVVVDKDEYDPGKIIGKCNIEIPTLNSQTGEIERSKIKYFCRHSVNKRMFRISTGDQSVEVTEDHSIIIIRNSTIVSVRPADICHGDKIIKI